MAVYALSRVSGSYVLAGWVTGDPAGGPAEVNGSGGAGAAGKVQRIRRDGCRNSPV